MGSVQGSSASSMGRLAQAKGAIMMECRRDPLKVPPKVLPERLGPYKRNEVALPRPQKGKSKQTG